VSADIISVRIPQRPRADAKTITVDRALFGELVALLSALVDDQPFEFGTHADMLAKPGHSRRGVHIVDNRQEKKRCGSGFYASDFPMVQPRRRIRILKCNIC
jgi:hypothetical protein